MQYRNFRRSLAGVLLLCTPLFAAKFWEKKEFTSWTEQECMEVLKKSPWAYSVGFGNVGPAVLQPPQSSQPQADTSTASRQAAPRSGPEYASGVTFGERESTLMFDFNLLTAKPVLAAKLQLQALRNPAIKEQVKRIVTESKPGEQIIIQFTYRTDPPGSSAVHDIHSYFLHATLADFSSNTTLGSDKVDVLRVKDYLPPNEKRPNPAFVFPRFNEKGDPYFTGQESSITFRSEFSPEIRGKKEQYKVFFQMNPKEMWFQKAFAF